MRSVRLVLVRHGESHANVQHRFQGQTDSGLTLRGRDQANDTAKALAAALPDVGYVAISDLPRVVDTAAPYMDVTGLPATTDIRLRELDTGTWSGRTFAEVEHEFPHETAAIMAGEDVRRGGGETFADLRARIVPALDDHAVKAADAGFRTAVVFCHGGPIRVAVAAALGLPEGGHRVVTPPGNCSVSIITRHIADDGTVATSSLISYNASAEGLCRGGE